MTPFQKANAASFTEKHVELTMEHMKIERAEAVAILTDRMEHANTFINDTYQVQVTDLGPVAHLNIRRRDGDVIMRDWREFQTIKNELVGPECEGIELYPAESRKADTSNKYHIFVVKDPTFRFPFGFEGRCVMDEEPGAPPGMRQRKL